ncbi:HlyD family secretion protein [Streptococcus dentapri]|uniref:HlyD family secretion protein n=1 Tax=Streptococcus dentapri TaxID=573564 RepID=A0ABV8CZE1_9STRE
MREKTPPKTHKKEIKQPLLRENRQKQKSKGLFRWQELVALAVLIVSAIILLLVTGSFKVLKGDVLNITSHFQIGSENLKPKYQQNQVVQVSEGTDKSIGGKDLTRYKQWIGKIQSNNQVDTDDGKSVMTYTIAFDNGDSIKGVKESDIAQAPHSKFSKDKIVQVSQSAETDLDGYDLSGVKGDAAKVSSIGYNYSDGGGYKYDLSFDDGTTYSNVAEYSLNDIYHVDLKEHNSAAQNNQVLKDSFQYAKDHPGTILGLPSGNFTIGSQNPESDYILLASDTQIRGDNTKLVVDGTAYWFGLATGSGASDGVQNFTMRDITVEAKDLTNGDQFMVMANHGSNWDIANNTFTMVHKKGSHVFDLGGLQNSSFTDNNFIGYAPDLSNTTSLSDVSDDHAVYAEAIQFDASDNKGVWDGGLIQKIDSNYTSNNQNKVLSNNIKVTGNSFLPYKDSSGKIVAYSATLGQHSSDVGSITVTGNTFTSTLSTRFNKKDDWVFDPIHFTESSGDSVYNNTID